VESVMCAAEPSRKVFAGSRTCRGGSCIRLRESRNNHKPSPSPLCSHPERSEAESKDLQAKNVLLAF